MHYKISQFPDGSKMPKISNFEETFVFRIESYEDLWLLRQLKDVYDHNNLNATVYIPWLIDGQADTRFAIDEPFSLKLVCQFIDSMKWDHVFIYHPHNPSIPASLIKNLTIIPNTTFISKVLNVLEADPKEWILLSPDAGAFKSLIKTAQSINWLGETFSASKARIVEGNNASLLQKVYREDFEAKNILIVDDICIKGGTFIGLAKLLKERNIGKLCLAVSHITIESPSEELFVLFDKIFVSNSHSIVSKVQKKANNLHIINLF